MWLRQDDDMSARRGDGMSSFALSLITVAATGVVVSLVVLTVETFRGTDPSDAWSVLAANATDGAIGLILRRRGRR